MSTIIEPNLAVFIGLTLVLVGGATVLSGRAIAENWRPAWQVVLAAFGLALTDRFLIFALFEGELGNLVGLLAHFLLLCAIGMAAWQITRASKMVRQYPWKYRRASIFSYSERSST